MWNRSGVTATISSVSESSLRLVVKTKEKKSLVQYTVLDVHRLHLHLTHAHTRLGTQRNQFVGKRIKFANGNSKLKEKQETVYLGKITFACSRCFSHLLSLSI
jgi:hypothetical protein